MPTQLPTSNRPLSSPTSIRSFSSLSSNSSRLGAVLHSLDYDSPEQAVKEYVQRFRVLVMGKRNAGKTTLLQKMTQSDDGLVEVRNPEGKLVDPSIITPSVERGKSVIDNEITFPSNRGFIFHDSRGMEAGSVDESRIVRDFISRRQSMKSLKDRIHIIWYCLPVDSDRVLLDEELAFFNFEELQGIPVVAIFTKFEWQVTKAFGVLRDEGVPVMKARKQAYDKARSDFKSKVLDDRKIEFLRYPPAGYVYLQKLHKGGDCEELTITTDWIIHDTIIGRLFSIVQQNSVQVSMGRTLVYAMAMAKKNALTNVDDSRMDEWTALLLCQFPCWNKNFFHLDRHWEMHWDWTRDWQWDMLLNVQDRGPIQKIMEKALSWLDPGATRGLQWLTFFVDVIMIAEHLFWISDGQPWDLQHIRATVSKYDENAHTGSEEQCTRLKMRGIVKRMWNEMNPTMHAFEQLYLTKDELKILAKKYVDTLLVHRIPFHVDVPRHGRLDVSF